MLRKKLKKLKRRMKKGLYNFLLALNEFDFKKLSLPFWGVAFTALLVVACLLPTTSNDNTNSAEVMYGSAIASDIRSTVTEYSTLEYDADVVAVFLPIGFEQMSETELVSSMEGKSLYSFYLTGKELSYLAESAVSVHTETYELYLDGLNFTYHENRLPFDRVAELTLSNSVTINETALYHIVATEEIFSLFHYGSYRSLGLMEISPKNRSGALLSDYQEAVVSEDQTALTVAASIAYAAMYPSSDSTGSHTASVVTTLGGFNLIDLWIYPNKVTVLICILFFTAVVLLWYALPRLHRVVLWFRIYAIRSKKRGRQIYYSRKRTSRSGYYRRAS